ncbi:MAG TPA: sugar phosphate isomerase/epimerase [Firmicutes bacterium]|nr:sugar phosphate isomerase/epimerase [Bacillota bacterium]
MALSASDPRKWPVGASTCTFPYPEFTDNLQACKEAGVSHIELIINGAWLEDEAGSAELHKRAEAIKHAGLTLWSAHLPFGRDWNIASSDAERRQYVLQVFTTLMQKLGDLGVTVAVIHPGAEPIADADREDTFKRSKDGLSYLAAVAKASGVVLAAENLPRTCIPNVSDEMLRLLDGSADLRVCLDANHSLKESTEAFVGKVGGKIVTVHMSDYDNVDERHWMPGQGVNNWTAIIRELSNCGYTGPFLYEVSQKKAGPFTPHDLVTCRQRLLDDYMVSHP